MYVSPTTPSWEDTFLRWAQPPGKTETTRCRNAEGAMRNAISKSPKLSAKNIKVFAQGSFRNRDAPGSDVDVGVLCWDTFLPDFPAMRHTAPWNTVATYSYGEFKDLGAALSISVPRGESRKQGIRPESSNTYRVEADVAPFFEHRRYRWDGSYLAGRLPDRGGLIVNYPERLLDTWLAALRKRGPGTRRATDVQGRRPHHQDRMQPDGQCRGSSSGFQRMPRLRNAASWTERVRSVLYPLDCTEARPELDEVNGVKRLFGPAQPWTDTRSTSSSTKRVSGMTRVHISAVVAVPSTGWLGLRGVGVSDEMTAFAGVRPPQPGRWTSGWRWRILQSSVPTFVGRGASTPVELRPPGDRRARPQDRLPGRGGISTLQMHLMTPEASC